MNKSYFSIVALILLVVFTSAQYTTPGAARVGDAAPELSLSRGGSRFSLQDNKMGYVLVTFWSSANPASRIDNQRYARCARQNAHVQHVAVNLDRTKGLMDQLIIADQLDAQWQFHPTDEAKVDIMRQWNVQSDNMTSYLVNAEGIIVDIDPSLEKIERL